MESCDIRWYISNCTRPMDTKHDNVVTYHERLLPIKSNYHLNKWSCEVNEIQMKDISPLARTYEPHTRQGGDLLWQAVTLKVTWPFNHVANVWSPDNLKKLFILALKLGRVITSVRRFRTQELKFFCFKSVCSLSYGALSAYVFSIGNFILRFSVLVSYC